MHKQSCPKITVICVITPSYAYVYRLICGAKMVPGLTKPPYTEIRQEK